MFVMLIVAALLSLLFFFLGHRLAEHMAAAEDVR